MKKSSHKDTEAERHPLVFYDGVCGFCQRVVQFIIPRDRSAAFRFVAIQSETGSRLLRRYGLDPAELNTFVLLEQGRVYTRSTAGLRVLRRLDGAWPLLYAFIVVPRPLRDVVYRWIAANRYRFFGKSDSCMLPPPEVRERFLDT
ncbi:thiol-disulfide oxidoreductase DCC family protein [Paenibacillus elgii]|uniref:thiol-disulfide oxidoreductase DCC family protein n=1 Tax=Paenibacillus elgii TaxID=189691 RepID=UPI0013D574EA|nr:thiol-disulfide oxidoreductase DCC family protein [Paenibacillus elgii]